MFVIYRKNRKFNTKTFRNYEAARSYVRKYLRKNADKMFNTNSMFKDNGWINHDNPSHSAYGFTIRQAS